MNFLKSETLKNMTRSFAGECMDGAKYQFIADTASQQKLSQVSTILKGLATNEMAHAKIFYDKIKELGGTDVDIVEVKATFPMKNDSFEQMFEILSNEEERQSENIYPAFAKVAENEGFEDVSKIFLKIADIESNHSIVLSKINQLIKNKSMYISETNHLWKCTNCGNKQEMKKAWNVCPLCNKDKGYIKLKLNTEEYNN